MTKLSADTVELLAKVESELARVEETDQQIFLRGKSGQSEDPCAYLGCGRIGLRSNSGTVWTKPRYASELSFYKSFMRLPAPIRAGWQWNQGVQCSAVQTWDNESIRTT